MQRIFKRVKDLYDAPTTQESGKFLRWNSGGTLENASVELPKAQVLNVAKSGADYTSVKTAIDYAITVASRTNPYIVKVAPGSYTESPFTMSRWVSLQGSGIFATVISTNNNSAHFITSSATDVGMCELSELSIQGPTGTGFAAIYYDAPYDPLLPNNYATNQRHHPFFIANVLVRAGYYGLLVNSGNVHCFNFGGYSAHSKANTKSFIKVQNYGYAAAMNCSYTCWFEKNATGVGFEVTGSNARMTLDGCSFTSPTYASDDPLYDYIYGSKQLSTWIAETPFAAGDILEKTFSYRGSSTTFFYVCTQGGDSGTVEPTWSLNTEIGAETTDGTVIWTNNGIKGSNWNSITKALSVDDGGFARLNNCSFANAKVLMHIGPNGSNTRVVCSGVNLKDADFTTNDDFKHIQIESASGSVEFSGVADKNKLDINASAKFLGSFSDHTAGEEGVVTVGELWLGTKDATIPMRDYGLKTYSTGLYDGGGLVTAGTGLHAEVIAGTGFINNGTSVKRIDWDGKSGVSAIDVTANSENYIYVDFNGLVQSNSIKPDLKLNVVLACCYTDSTSIVSIADYNAEIEQIIPTLHEYFAEAIGPISITGGLATINSAPSRSIDVSGGSFYRAYEKTTSDGATPATFTYWYKKSGGGWNHIASQTNIDNTQYDDGSGTLATMTDANYRKDVLFIVVAGPTTEFHVVYGQEQFASKEGAEAGNIPSCPNYLLEHGIRSSGVVIAKSSNIQSIVDLRPKLGQAAPAVATISNHNDLSGIQGGQAGQYYHLNSTQYNDLANKIVISASNMTFGSGTVQLIGSHAVNIATDTGNKIIFDVPSQSVQTQGLVSVNGSQSAISISGGSNITISNNASTVIVHGPSQIVNAAVIRGNTSGTTASISSGTMTFAGGNNITLSQANNAVTIIGATTGNFYLSNSNNISFGISADATNSTVTASASFPAQTQFVLSASNGLAWGTNGSTVTGSYSQSTHSHTEYVFSNSNNISFGINGSTVTASASFAGGGLAVAAAGNTTGTMATITNGTMTFAGGNNITLSQNASAITILAPNASSLSGYANITVSSTGNTINLSVAPQTSLAFSNSNNVNFGINGSTITASATFPVQTKYNFSNSNSFTFGTGTGANTSVVTASFSQSTHSHSVVPSAFAVIGNTAGAMATITNNTIVLSGGNHVTLSQDGNTIGISAHSPVYLSAGTTSASNGTIAWSNSNNVSFGMNGSTITASATFPAQTQFVLTNLNGFGWTTNGSTVTGSYSQSTHSHSEYSFINSNNVSFSTTNGSQVYATASFAGGGGAAIAAGGNTAGAMSTITNGTAVFMGGPNITMSQNGNSITISGNNPGAAAEANYHAIGGNSAGANSTLSGSTIGIYGGNNITVSQNGSTITISAPNMVQGLSGSVGTIDGGVVTFGNSNGVSFYVTNGSMVASYLPANTATYLSMYPPIPLPFVQYSSLSVAGYSGSSGTGASTSLTTCSAAVFPLAIGANLSYEGVRLPVLSSMTTTVSSVNFSNSWGFSFGLYTQNGTNLSSLSQWTAEYRYTYASATNSTNASASWQASYGHVGGNSSSTSIATDNAADKAYYSYLTGSKWIKFAGSELGGQTLAASQYYGVLNASVKTAGSSLHVNSLCALSAYNSTWGQDIGYQMVNQRNMFPAQGVISFVLSTNGPNLPAAIATADITQTGATNVSSLINKFPYIMINNRL